MSFLGSLFKRPEDTGLAAASTPLEVVMTAATLVSSPKEIDPVLDKVRGITVRVKPGEARKPEDTSVLWGVYLKVEEYLTVKEPLRSFTKDELRGRLRPELRNQIEAYEAKG
jgi:hypothetical protein